ncbi:hypothetical protein [Gluconobacter sphaericus]|uniref:hypothetical protein n=1 Tax=Gluconobacter sphaericus TaxID=574987 RepID=UPI00312B5AC8
MSENEYEKDLSNFEEVAKKTFVNGHVLKGDDLIKAFVALKNYVIELEKKVEHIKK